MTRIKNKVILFSKKRERLGSELLLNGGFDTDSGWIKGGGWIITGGELVVNSAAYTTVRQNGIIEIGKTYKLTFSIVKYTSGSCWIGSNLAVGTLRNAIGTYTIDWVSDTVDIFIESGGSGFIGSIDNVSVREVL